MAPAYRSLEDGQIVVSDEPRPDLEAVARWEKIGEDEAREILDAADPEAPDEDEARLIAFIDEHGLTAADVLAMLTAEPPSESEPVEPPVEEIPPVETTPVVVVADEPVEPPVEAKPARGRRKPADE